MGFLFPLFLLAGLSILIPIIIHLVNLRKYKKEFFPNLRFLKDLKIVSKRSAKINKKWLLLTRILFLLALVTAFAHPFLQNKNSADKNKASQQIIYIDNSLSMSAQNNGQTLLSLAKNQAQGLVASAGKDAQFIIVTNDQPFISGTLNQTEAQKQINEIKFTSKPFSLEELKNLVAVQNSQQAMPAQTQLFVFSDMQQSTLLKKQGNFKDSLKAATFYLFPVQAKEVQNQFIDSAAIIFPENSADGITQVVAKIGRVDSGKNTQVNLRLLANGQTRSVKNLNFPSGKAIIQDTLPLSLPKEDWTRIELIIEDGNVSFDDTFRLVAQKPAGYSVLVLSANNNTNPYLQAALGSMPGVNWQSSSYADIGNKKLQDFSLIIVQDGSNLPQSIGDILKSQLEAGKNVLLFPGSKSTGNLNSILASWNSIHFGSLDTAKAEVVSLERNHPLVKDIFESIPEQVQLPTAQRHFELSAALSANQQDIMSFADGTPLLSTFNFAPGRVYICTSSLEGQSTDFPLSYFFAPFVYKMAVPSGAGQQFNTIVGSSNPILLPNNGSMSDRQVWHLLRHGTDIVPHQSLSGQGLGIYAGQAVQEAGFYTLKQEGETTDSLLVAINNDPIESDLIYASKKLVEQALDGSKVVWLNAEKIKNQGWNLDTQPFPLWKVAVIIALLCLLAETLLLTGFERKKESAPLSEPA